MKVAIAGYGVEGAASYRYWLGLGDEVFIFDQKNPTVAMDSNSRLKVGEDVFKNLYGYDLVIRTASLRPDNIKTDGKIWSATNEFFSKCPSPIIGVTGTKGKGTTCTLITEILRKAGMTVHLVGNIGTPALEVLPHVKQNDIVVFELSSFQLWDLEMSPNTSVVLMIEPDHLNVHNDMEEYVRAKSNISSHQTVDDVVIYNPHNIYSSKIATYSAGRKIQYLSSPGAYVNNNKITIDNIDVVDVGNIKLLGSHNIDNICAAITAVWKYCKDINSIKIATEEFKGLPHRLEFVEEVDGTQYYNDSYSSAPMATIAAARAFVDPKIIICGGVDKGIDYTEFAKDISSQTNVKKVILIGRVKDRLARAFDNIEFSDFEVVDSVDMIDIVNRCKELANPGDVVLLSPGSASFDMFDNFEDRGNRFKKAVRGLK